jgi:NAD(P)-dependent dehydrogenase (short-subunit alcohol dehydrogenase family)
MAAGRLSGSAAMLFLASEDSSFVAGSELLVDGGMCSV